MSLRSSDRAESIALLISCPSCGRPDCELFYEATAVPTNSCLLVKTREAALDFPTGDVALYFCSGCGFVFNGSWEEGRTVYSEEYEETQGFSPTFAAFDRGLAASLVDRHDLHGKTIFEIGCGKGEFLSLLCEIGDNKGIGYDPSFVPARQPLAAAGRLTLSRTFFDETTDIDNVDFVCCKMTFEHLSRTGEFIRNLRCAVTRSPDAVCFIQVPNFESIIERTAYWDVYYEHCSYFTSASLAGLLVREGFEVIRSWTDYDDQYLMIEARPGSPGDLSSRMTSASVSPERIRDFSTAAAQRQARWRERFLDYKERGLRTAVWGSGSKAVSFLSAAGIGRFVDLVVDINPFRQGMYMPGTGHPIVSPESLASHRPDVVVVMNPVYIREIREKFLVSGHRPTLLSILQ